MALPYILLLKEPKKTLMRIHVIQCAGGRILAIGNRVKGD